MIIRARVSRVASFLRVSIISGEVVIARFRRNRCLELEFGIIRLMKIGDILMNLLRYF